MEQRVGFRIVNLGRHRAWSLKTDDRGQLNIVQSFMFKVPSFLTNLRRILKLEGLNFKP